MKPVFEHDLQVPQERLRRSLLHRGLEVRKVDRWVDVVEQVRQLARDGGLPDRDDYRAVVALQRQRELCQKLWAPSAEVCARSEVAVAVIIPLLALRWPWALLFLNLVWNTVGRWRLAAVSKFEPVANTAHEILLCHILSKALRAHAFVTVRAAKPTPRIYISWTRPRTSPRRHCLGKKLNRGVPDGALCPRLPDRGLVPCSLSSVPVHQRVWQRECDRRAATLRSV